jgi:hypothetical protein
MGEQHELMIPSDEGRIGIDTYAGKIHVEWDPQAAVTPLGQLPFFISFLKIRGLYDDFVASCPLSYTSPNAPDRRDVLGTLLMSVLAGHHRYAHITSLRFDSVNPELLGMTKVISEDATRRALKSMDEEAGIAWLNEQLYKSTESALSLGSPGYSIPIPQSNVSTANRKGLLSATIRRKKDGRRTTTTPASWATPAWH